MLSSSHRYLKAVAQIASSGALGATVLLGAAAPGAANQEPTARQPASLEGERVAERLAAIREAVSTVVAADATAPEQLRLAWGNWRNWGPGFGLGYGRPWGNFGFGVPWSNWNNWRNGWHNWGNWWHNW